jgi:pantothenate kinase
MAASSRPSSPAHFERDQPPPASAFVGGWEAEMAQHIQKEMQAAPDRLPYMVAVVGTPGSGKSISSLLLANELEQQCGLPCMVLPHDGYHYTLDYLKQSFPNADDAIYRRGAPDTFDPHALKRDLDRIRDNSSSSEGEELLITLPGFDHHRGDPEPEKHAFDRHRHKVVVCEGLYLLHDQDGWEDIAQVFDLKIYMNSDLEVCLDRVKIRNQCIPGYTPEEIAERTEKVDRINALTVMRSKGRADIVVDSLAMTSK